MKELKRATVGGFVQMDVSGTGDIVFGTITKVDGTKITFKPSDGSKLVKAEKAELFKATKAEVTKFGGKPAAAKVEDGEEDGEEGEAVRGTIVPQKYRDKYTKASLPSGRATLHNNDEVAQSMVGMDLTTAQSMVAKAMKVTAVSLKARWEHLNPGQQRMLLGNVYRKFLRDQEEG